VFCYLRRARGTTRLPPPDERNDASDDDDERRPSDSWHYDKSGVCGSYDPPLRALAAAIALDDHRPREGEIARSTKPGDGDDEADAAIARLRVAEGEQRRLADQIAAVAGGDVPEIVHVA